MHHKSSLKLFVAICILGFAVASCNSDSNGYKVSVTNNSELVRSSETIEVALNELPDLSYSTGEEICVKDESGNRILSQLVDEKSVSGIDYLIFQSDFAADETKHFTISVSDDNPAMPEASALTFCRFVPERIDDFAWENDRVAFRTYGPACQKLFEDGNPAGLISSGIDCWLKRVDYPIIDKWYKNDTSGKSYHQDHGEGLDNYNVGTTRGCGGSAILENEQYVYSENFTNWNIIGNGPIRSIFELEYAQDEKKKFTIDLGSNFYHCDVKYNYSEPVQQIGIGIAHHDSNGEVNLNKETKSLTYWEALGDSHLGTAIIVNSKADLSLNSDAENNWVNLSISGNSISYWSGFGWEKADLFSSSSDWNEYVSGFLDSKKNPLVVKIKIDR